MVRCRHTVLIDAHMFLMMGWVCLSRRGNVFILKDVCERSAFMQMCTQVAHRSEIGCEPSGLFLC